MANMKITVEIDQQTSRPAETVSNPHDYALRYAYRCIRHRFDKRTRHPRYAHQEADELAHDAMASTAHLWAGTNDKERVRSAVACWIKDYFRSDRRTYRDRLIGPDTLESVKAPVDNEDTTGRYAWVRHCYAHLGDVDQRICDALVALDAPTVREIGERANVPKSTTGDALKALRVKFDWVRAILEMAKAELSDNVSANM